MNLTLRIFLALLAGLAVGALLPADIGKPLLPVTDAIGNLWLQALQMTIIPLIAGLLFTGKDDTGTRMEIVELPRDVHPFFFATQFHPEFLSRPVRGG